MPVFPLLYLNGGKLNYEANRILQRGKYLNKINDGTVIIMVTGTVGTRRTFSIYNQTQTLLPISHRTRYDFIAS
jgi:hypothetical protein